MSNTTNVQNANMRLSSVGIYPLNVLYVEVVNIKNFYVVLCEILANTRNL